MKNGEDENETGDIEHYHCPFEHDHPQPFFGTHKDGRTGWWCGACWFRDRELTLCELCVPGENC
jgi:hypothetical protein